MKIAVLTGSSAEMRPVLLASLQSKYEYCLRHGYDLINIAFSDFKYLGYQRLETTIDALGVYDMVAWIDGDSIITNQDFTIPSIAGDSVFSASCDWWTPSGYFSTGNFIIRKHPFFQSFKEEYYREKARHFPHYNQEQETLNFLWKRKPKLFSILPHEMLNAVPERVREDQKWQGRLGIVRPWAQGDFLAHLTGCGNESRLSIMQGLSI